MKLFKNVSVRRKLFLIVIAIFTFSTLAAAIYTALSFLNSSKQISENTAKIINDNYANHITAEIEKGVSLTKTISGSILVKSNNEKSYVSAEQESALYELVDNNEFITDLFLVLNSSFKIEQNNDPLTVYEISLHKSNDGISREIYDERNFSVDFSKLKKNNDKQTVIVSEPIWLKYTKEDKLVISIVSPIYKDFV